MIGKKSRNAVYILSIDAKDLYLASQISDNGFGIKRPDGSINTRKFRNTLDYSLDLRRLRELHYHIFRNRYFGFWADGKEYTTQVINVTFKYSVKEFNIAAPNTFVRIGYECFQSDFTDGVVIRDGQLVGIKLKQKIKNPIDASLLDNHFAFENGEYVLKSGFKTLVTTDELRQQIYKDGFICDGKQYVRWKRSSGSSRVGKCLFIVKPMYRQMHKIDCHGIEIKKNNPIDLAAFESYQSLTLSSIVDVLVLDPQSILVIDDYDSIFKDDILAVEEVDSKLVCKRGDYRIRNSIWDGQSLIDKSAMGEYSDKGMILLRNSFFKSCCFNCNLQQWFKDNSITEISQLNGQTRAKSVEDIKLVTTPSSIKYLKFGSLDDWLDRLDRHFGLVKYDKVTHFFDGAKVQTHYQLLNSIQMTADEVTEFMKPSLDFIDLLKSDIDVLRSYIKCFVEEEYSPTTVSTKNDVIYKLLGLNNRFAETKMYRDFKYDLIRSMLKNLKCGHVLVNGNYSVLCGNPIEMLQSAIGRFDGEPQISRGCVHSTRFDYDKTVLGSRSPHITMSNVWLAKNEANEMIDRYLNVTPEILCLNSIGENVLNRLSGCDFDSDTVLLTDDEILIRAAERNDGKFPVAVSFANYSLTKRKYCPEQLADLDIKTKSNKIGEIVNLSQELNSRVWNMLNNGGTDDDVMEIYYDIAKLNVLSGIEIDKAKREFSVDSGKELRAIRQKYEEYDNSKENPRAIRPFFFAHIFRQKGYYNADKKAFISHDTTMDYLQHEVNKYSRSHGRRKCPPPKPLSIIIDYENYDSDHANGYWRMINELYQEIEDAKSDLNRIRNEKESTLSEKAAEICERRALCVREMAKRKINKDVAIALFNKLESDTRPKFKEFGMYLMFDPRLTPVFEIIANSKEPINDLVMSPDGDINIYGDWYTKVPISAKKSHKAGITTVAPILDPKKHSVCQIKNA